MVKKICVRNNGKKLVLQLMDPAAMVAGHLQLMDKLKTWTGSGGRKNSSFEQECMTDLFVILFGIKGAQKITAFYGGDCDMALSAISRDYDRKIHPNLVKLREKKEFS